MEEQNNILEPKKKSPIGLIILMVILMIGCLVGGYFLNESGVFDKFQKDTEEKGDKDKKDEKEPVVTNYEVTDEKVSKLIDKIDVGALENCNGFEDYANDKKVMAKDVSPWKAYRIGEREFFNSGRQTISLDEFTKAIQKYLGKDYNYVPLTDAEEKGKCISYVYDESTKNFNFQKTACGGTCGPTTNYKLVKAVDTDGVLELDVKVIFASYEEGKMGYYSDYTKTNKIGDFDYYNVDSLYDKGSDYVFTFKLEDDNYVFVSSEPAK